MWRPRNRWAYAVPVIGVAAGLLFGVSAATSQGSDLRPGTRDLVQVVQDGNHRVAKQAATVASLQTQVAQLGKQDAPGSTKLKKTIRTSDGYADTAGLSEVTGQVVTVSLNDSSRDPSTLPDGANLDWLVVHQQDVQAVVNALWAGGASAMMLMDQRVISTSAVRCVGNTLLLQGRVYSPPFVIKAMGDPAKLKKALDDDPSVQNYKAYVSLAGLGYDVSTSSKETFPAYQGALDLKYAKVKEAAQK
ncbi:DUF881 domain-containing protein [Flexivirga oryzae]|uniref:Uncharacterized protein YlxW (UPF0749 family) n=1 Tax=Flexivirga oryzae TaxID=1794944 RepID=A0A839NBI3_9MICO|nr:DUF881 domain-containing protein [Flexivirga oryzae]MBB2893603.1 uncharacterized protein YlxW (UPF0749 family) [Flexivirga oryzae]